MKWMKDVIKLMNWTREDTIKVAASIVSGVIGSLLCMKLLGVM